MLRLVLVGFALAVFLISPADAGFSRLVRDIRRTTENVEKVVEARKDVTAKAIAEAERTNLRIEKIDDPAELTKVAKELVAQNLAERERNSGEIARLEISRIQLELRQSLIEQERRELARSTEQLERSKADVERRERLWSASTIGLGATTLFGIFGCWLAWRSNADQRERVRIEIAKITLEMAKLRAASSSPTDTT